MGDGCDDHHGDGTRLICRGEELSADFIALLERAASGEPVVSMTVEETAERIRSL